ncbi:MAG: hypothetical protein ACTSUN_09000 [Promethearchaeota archaeon]
MFQLGKINIYHPRDCVPYDGLIDFLKAKTMHLALMPINGRDEHGLK